MKKEELLKKVEGLSDDLAEKVIKFYEGYVPKNRFDEVNEAKKNAESLVKERDSQIERLKAATANNETLKAQIIELQENNKKAVEAKDAEIKKIKLDNAVNTALIGAGAKNVKAVLPFIELENVDFDENGNIKGLTEQIDDLKKAEDCSFLFKSENATTTTRGVTPINTNSKTEGLTKADFNRMSYKERVELYNSNEALYGSLAND